VRELDHATEGRIPQLGPSYKMSETPPRVTGGSPLLGEQTDELLAEIGIDERERKRLYDAGIAR
jgi:crotonobetainyl-CoA:carnitine CoA-transferase CaiB-like acyl-CoA transferase